LYKWIPQIRNWKEALFTGHFGPMGVGAVFVSTLALHMLPAPNYPPQTQEDLLALTLQPIVTFVVLGSIIIHGLSIPFFNFGRSVQSRTSTFTAYARTLTRSRTTTRFSPPEWINQITAGWGFPVGDGSAAGPREDLDRRVVVVDIENANSTTAKHEETTSVSDEGRRDIVAEDNVDDEHPPQLLPVDRSGSGKSSAIQSTQRLGTWSSDASIQTVQRSQVNVAVSLQ